MLRRSFEFLCTLAALAGLAVSFQVKSGAFWSEIADSDESAHYINGLMVHDYLQSGLHVGPIKYAIDYYIQYPKVSIGHWPPLYYIVEALWMALFSSSRVSVFLFSSVLTALLATVIASQARRSYGNITGLLAAIVFVALPSVQYNTARLGLDLPVALLDLAAALTYARYLDKGYWRYSLLFAVVASTAIMVKGNAMELALLPAFAVLFGGRYILLRQLSFWLPALIVIVLCGPWYALTYKISSDGFVYQWGIDYVELAMLANSYHLVAVAGGILPCLLASIGVAARIAAQDARRIPDNRALVLLSLIAAVFTFQMIIPTAIDERYMLPALPPIVLFAVDGIVVMARWPVRYWRDRIFAFSHPNAESVAACMIAVFTVGPSAPTIAYVPAKPRTGMIEVARQILMPGANSNPLVLIAASSAGEGGLIVEMAMHDVARHYYVLRASRILSESNFMGRNYKVFFHSSSDALARLDDLGVGQLVFDDSDKSLEMEHDRQVQSAIANFPGRWRLLGDYQQSNGAQTLLYELANNEGRGIDLAKIVAATSPIKVVGR